MEEYEQISTPTTDWAAECFHKELIVADTKIEAATPETNKLIKRKAKEQRKLNEKMKHINGKIFALYEAKKNDNAAGKEA